MELIKFTEQLKRSALVHEIDFVPKGHARIETGFRYPDGSSVDIFIKKDESLIRNIHPLRLTDFGSTLAWLNTLQIRPFKSKKRERLANSVLETYNIKRDGGSFYCDVNSSDVESGIIRLGQACLRIADLVFLQRFVSQGSFEEEVEEVIAETSLEYETKASINAPSGKIVEVDFKVKSQKTETAVFILPSETKSQQHAHNKATDVFSKCYDLREWMGQKVAAWDDRNQIYKDSDIDRISEIAQVLPISDPSTFQQYLQAA